MKLSDVLSRTALLVTTTFAGELSVRQSTCSPLELVYARGTGEPPNPSFGNGVGDPLFNATKALLPDVTGYAVKYPATLAEDSRWIGTQDAVNHINAQSTACPAQQFALVGYSQGADVMHYVTGNLSTSLYPRMVALVMFGDPGNRGVGAFDPLGGTLPPFPDALAAKLKQNCAHDDLVCTNNGTSIPAHISYNSNGTTYMQDSAKYIQAQFQSGGQAGPQPAAEGPGSQTPANFEALQNLGNIIAARASSTGVQASSTTTNSVGAPTAASTTASSSAGGASPATESANAAARLRISW